MREWMKFGLCGAAAGLINGFFGAGGGMVLVPFLLKLGGLRDQEAFAASLTIMLPICMVSLAARCIQGAVPPPASLLYLPGGFLGGLAGGFLLRHMKPRYLHGIFGLLMLWGGIRLLWN